MEKSELQSLSDGPGGVSIILSTKKPQFIDNLFANYKRQIWGKKEIILILNKDNLNLAKYKEKAKYFPNVSVYQLPEKTSLGMCLNYAIDRSKHEIIAKFDDDDYYGPYYLTGVMRAFQNPSIDVIGKRTRYTYLEHKKLLLLHSPNWEFRNTDFVAGGTICFRRKVLQKVRFSDKTIGEDVTFIWDCKNNGYRVYSIGKNQYVYIRRANRKNHTWQESDSSLLRGSKIIAKTANYIPFVLNHKS